MRHVLVDGMNAYYHRDADSLRKLLERLDGSGPRNKNYDFRPLTEAAALWAKEKTDAKPAIRRASADLLAHAVPGGGEHA